jgi:uncharacterized membrane protein
MMENAIKLVSSYVALSVEAVVAVLITFAGIIRTAIASTRTDVGELASTATIRTVLNYFLEVDIEKLRTRDETQPA